MNPSARGNRPDLELKKGGIFFFRSNRAKIRDIQESSHLRPDMICLVVDESSVEAKRPAQEGERVRPLTATASSRLQQNSRIGVTRKLSFNSAIMAPGKRLDRSVSCLFLIRKKKESSGSTAYNFRGFIQENEYE